MWSTWDLRLSRAEEHRRQEERQEDLGEIIDLSSEE